jgi:hypothetical protein
VVAGRVCQSCRELLSRASGMVESARAARLLDGIYDQSMTETVPRPYPERVRQMAASTTPCPTLRVTARETLRALSR